MGQDNPKHKYRLGREQMESSPEERDLQVLVDEKLNMTRQCVLTAQYPGLHQRKCVQQVEGCDSDTLLCSGETPPEVLCPALERSASKSHGPAAVVPEEGQK